MTEYEKMGGTYRQEGDYILPNLKVAAGQDNTIGMWGERHRRFLESHHRIRYYNLLTNGTLNCYLADINQQAEEMFESIVKSLAEKEGVTENLKVTTPMEWVRKMNNIRNRATWTMYEVYPTVISTFLPLKATPYL